MGEVSRAVADISGVAEVLQVIEARAADADKEYIRWALATVEHAAGRLSSFDFKEVKT